MLTSNRRTRTALWRTLDLPGSRPGTEAHRRQAFMAMTTYTPSHGVSRQWWSRLVFLWHERVGHGWEIGPAPGGVGLVSEDIWQNGGPQPLYRPVSNIFNLVVAPTRMDAFDWISDRVANWTVENNDEPDDFAVFDMGPGGDFAARRAAAHLHTYLKMPVADGTRLINLLEHRIIVEAMAGNALLVRVQGREMLFAATHFRPTQLPMELLRNVFWDPHSHVTRWAHVIGQVDRPVTRALLHHRFTHPWELSETAGLV